jgi:methionyl-tRNA synthetase
MQKYYITTAIDYVNARPHIGHAYEKVAADILARFHRLQGEQVFFLTGLDEHGVKVQKSAQEAGIETQQFCDQMADRFKATWAKLGITYDYFIRTTEARHKEAVQEIFRRFEKNGDVYKSSYTGLYCEGCEDFIRERDLDETGNCPNHKKPPKQVSEENYFFRLSKYRAAVKKWLTDAELVMPEGRRKEVINQIDDPELSDFSVSRTRSSFTWGIPVPGESEQIIYVWIDALANYITALGFPFEQAKMTDYWPANLHLIGKDIVKFHAIYWPAMLLALDLPLPKQIYAHGFITVEGQKLSKSLGNVIDPNALVDEFGADALRFYLFASTPFDQDGDFSKEEFVRKVNSELANNLGNLLNRTLSLLERHCESLVPQSDPEHFLREEANEIQVTINKHMAKLEFAKTIEAIFALVDQANKYLNDEKPWSQFKQGKQKEGEQVLFTALEILRRTAINLYPFTPALSANIWDQLGFQSDLSKLGEVGKSDSSPYFTVIPSGQRINNKGPIFKRIEEAVV